jgi:hypothetical protein
MLCFTRDCARLELIYNFHGHNKGNVQCHTEVEVREFKGFPNNPNAIARGDIGGLIAAHRTCFTIVKQQICYGRDVAQVYSIDQWQPVAKALAAVYGFEMI